MKTARQDVQAHLDDLLVQFEKHGENLSTDHEFIANFVGEIASLELAHPKLIEKGFFGDAPDDFAWIYMHVLRPLTRESVMRLATESETIATESGCLFELLDVTLQTGPLAETCTILGVCDGEVFTNAQAR